MADAQTHFEQGQEYRKQGELDEAIAEFKKAVQLSPLYTEAHREYIDVMLKRGKRAEILAEYQAMVRQHPDSEVYHYLLGRVLDNVDDKLREFKKAVEINPDYAWGHYGLGWAYNNKEMLNEAIAEYKEAIKMKPDFAEAHHNLGSVYRSQGKLDEAIKEYQEAIGTKSDYPCTHCRLGTAYSSKKQLDLAIAAYEKATEMKPDCAEAHYNLGNAYKKQGKLEEAIAEYKAAISIKPEYEQAHNNLGVIYDNQGKMEEAIAEWKIAISIKPEYEQAHNNLGYAYKKQGNLEEAIAEYKTAININPNYATAHHNLSIAYKDQGKLDEAIKEYQEIIRIKPDDANAHHFLGHAYFDKNMFDEAIAEWKRTIELTPDDARLYKDLRNVYFKAGKLDELIDETEQSMEADANDARGHYLLALALAEKWEAKRAIESFGKAIELDPSYEAAHENYIDLMKRRGRHAEVRAEYKEKAEAQPDNELWDKLLERVPPKRKRLIPPMCALCIGRGVFKLAYLQFILLVGGISVGIASFAGAGEIISFNYLALAIYVAIICAILAPVSGVLLGGMVSIEVKKRAGKDARLPAKLISIAIGLLFGLVGSLMFVSIAILTYAAMQIFHASWWIPIAALGVLARIVRSEFVSLANLIERKPIEDPILVERLTGLIERCNVKVKDILRVDIDKLPRAMVAGILLPKRILINNSMLQRFSIPEVEAVFAHELGHVKAGAVQKKFFVQSVLIFVRLYLANLIYGILLPVYGFSGPEQIAALPLLAFCWLILGLPVRAIRSWVSRYFEKKADRYAISVVGESLFLSTFDKILEARQEQVLWPIIDFVCHSHPCREKRLHISKSLASRLTQRKNHAKLK